MLRAIDAAIEGSAARMTGAAASVMADFLFIVFLLLPGRGALGNCDAL
jgi:hypothetical protein